MADLTKTVDGKALPASKFAYVGDSQDISTWHLPIDSDHVGSALKMYGHETHVPPSKKKDVARKIAAAAKAHGLDTTGFEAKYCGGSVEHSDSSPWIEIFRAGDYRPQGKALITRNDLERVVRNYDPTYHEAPVCVGHPENNLPAYGWIERLALDGDKLLAKEQQVDPQFNEARKAGRYKKRSAAFYSDADGAIAGLRHVAYLGAQPPEVKGLKDVQFDDNGREFIEMSFGEEESVADDNKTLDERIRAFFSEMFSGKQGAQTFSEADVKRIASEAAASASAPLTAKITQLEADLKTQATTFSERETKIAGAEIKQRAVDAVGRLKAAGKWIPAFDHMGLPAVFDELAKNTTTLEFGEGDAKKKATPLEALVQFVEGLPQIVPQGRIYQGGSAKATAKGTGDPLTDLARARQVEKKITFSEALGQIAEEQPELTEPGAGRAGYAAAGAV